MDAQVCPGDVLLGKYRVERILGQGGMGVVAAARHLELGELFAIKFVLPKMVEHPHALERFMREARAAARLRSEHVVRVHDVGRMDNGASYMIMEHLDGPDLSTLLRRTGALPMADAIAYVLQVCDAIAEAHACGIIHRDLKPSNMILTHRPNGSPCVKVLDFGISRQMDGSQGGLTGTGELLGSPSYMSPEQMAHSKAVDARTDIWALGVILQEFVTARTPFRGRTVMDMVTAVLYGDPTPICEIRPDAPPQLQAVISKCLRKRPDERFQSVHELVAAMQPLQRMSLQSASYVGAAPVMPDGGQRSLEATKIDSLVAPSSSVVAMQSRLRPSLGRVLGAAVSIAAIGGIALFATRTGEPVIEIVAPVQSTRSIPMAHVAPELNQVASPSSTSSPPAPAGVTPQTSPAATVAPRLAPAKVKKKSGGSGDVVDPWGK